VAAQTGTNAQTGGQTGDGQADTDDRSAARPSPKLDAATAVTTTATTTATMTVPADVATTPQATAPASVAATPTPSQAQTTAVLQQVFPQITRVAGAAGTHRLAITLHPEQLGEVKVTVVVRAGSVHVTVATDPTNGLARTALEHGAPELRRLLEATGGDARLTFGDLGQGSSQPQGSGQQPGQPGQPGQQWAQGGATDTSGQGGRHEPAASQPQPQATVGRGRPSYDGPTTAADDSRPVRPATSGVDQLI
jgi:flagellar hook-length control protein FliK